MPYLNLDLNYFEHPKTKRLVGLLGRGAEVLPIKLWSYCGRLHAEDGRLARYTVQEIESIVGWWGHSGRMVEAFEASGFIGRDSKGYFVHEWSEHQGHIINFHRRAKAAAAARWEVDASSNASGNASSEVKQCPNQPTKPTNRKGKPPDPLPPLPPALDVPKFRTAWDRWQRHRSEIRKPLKPAMAEGQLVQFQAWGVEHSVRVIDHTITMGWQGLREPDATRGNNGTSRTKIRATDEAAMLESLSQTEAH